MKIKWLGHASFLVTSDTGTRIITDPYTTGTVKTAKRRSKGGFGSFDSTSIRGMGDLFMGKWLARRRFNMWY